MTETEPQDGVDIVADTLVDHMMRTETSAPGWRQVCSCGEFSVALDEDFDRSNRHQAAAVVEALTEAGLLP